MSGVSNSYSGFTDHQRFRNHNLRTTTLKQKPHCINDKKPYAWVADNICIQKGREVGFKSLTRILNEGGVVFWGQ